MFTTGDNAPHGEDLSFHVPLAVFADLAAQAMLLVDPVSQKAMFASARAQTLLLPNGIKPHLPAPLSELLVMEEQLSDQMRLALMISSPLSFGITSLVGGDRILAKVQRFSFHGGPPLLLMSLQDEPELAQRFKSPATRSLRSIRQLQDALKSNAHCRARPQHCAGRLPSCANWPQSPPRMDSTLRWPVKSSLTRSGDRAPSC